MTQLSKAQTPSRKGIQSKRSLSTNIPTRRSSRVTTERLKVEVEEAMKKGDEALIQLKKAQLEEALQKKFENSYESQVTFDSSNASDIRERFSKEPIPIFPPYNQPSSEPDTNKWGYPIIESIKSFPSSSLSTSTSTSSTSTSNAAVMNNSSSWPSITTFNNNIKNLNLDEKDVAKLTPNRITSTCFHPTTSKVLVAAGDKEGYLGLWDVDSHDGNDGVLMFRPHVSNIAVLNCWVNDPYKIWSVSYDGTVRFMDVQAEQFVLGFQTPEDLDQIYLSDASFSPNNSNEILIGRSDGKVGHIDIRQSSDSNYSWIIQTQQSKVNSVQHIPLSEHLIVTAGAGKDGMIAIHDTRKVTQTKNEPQKNLCLYKFNKHTKSINAAAYSPDGNYLVSVSQDNTIKLWNNVSSQTLSSGESTKPSCQSISHDNHTGRWLSTFRPVFDPKQAHTFMIGSMARPRMIEFFSVQSGSNNDSDAVNLKRVATLMKDSLNSVCSRNAFHPSLNMIAGGNSSGRVHIFR